ncbi:MAG: response regulator [Candidatus Omnitrophica bacterium CG07_land_8_20_14_0_80_42_15]|uniref:Response regulator n=1 Tax=Candidatus Aquitaenariimonas noxiae TaxID=1974741 RepID=A0A2J0L317_9BACT|nr:MAG: response regulator [Candidatus Omnitrophica bacterium CG07_land_8_20_14_0_80_42_15]
MKKILIVDDDKDLTGLVKSALEDTGKYEVLTENNGSNGLAATKAFKPDLILLDVMMPGTDGPYVASLIKKDITLKNIPIVFLTAAVTTEETRSRDGVIGGYPFMAKPISIKELLRFIENNLKED